MTQATTLMRFSKRWMLSLLGLAAIVLSGCIESTGTTRGPRVDVTEPVIVGLLVPTGSGDAQKDRLGQSLVNAAKLAVSEYAAQEVKIDLRVYATGGNAEQAAIQAQKAVEEGAKVLVGPLFAESAVAVGNAIAGKGISILSLSNNASVAGGNVFVLGDTFGNTTDRLVGFAARRSSVSYAIAAQNGVSGDIAIAALQNATARHGGTYVGAARYALTTKGVIDSIGAIQSLVREQGADTLMLDAYPAGALPLFAQMLPENGVTAASVQMLGLARWDQTSEQIQTNPGLQGVLFTMPDTTALSGFNSRYAASFGGVPHSLAGKSYDGIRAIGTLIAEGAAAGERAQLSPEALVRAQGYTGAAGVFRLMPDGTNQRALAVAEFRDGKVVVIDPAPRGFGVPGS